MKLHSGGLGGGGGVGMHSVIPQPLSDNPSPMMRSSSSSATSSPHGHPVLTSSSAPLSMVSDTIDTPPSSSMLLTQMNQLGPSERCTQSQAVSMGQQLLAIIAQHERSKMPLPG